MQEIAVKRELNEETRKHGVPINGEVYSLHITDTEMIFTDNSDFTKIYAVMSREFGNEMFCRQERQRKRCDEKS